MSLYMFKGKFQRIGLSLSRFRLVRKSFLWWRCLNLVAFPNKIDLNVMFGWCDLPLMNCFPSAVIFSMPFVTTSPKSSSVVMQ